MPYCKIWVEHKPPIKDVYDFNFVKQLIPFLPTLKKAQFYGGEPLLIPIYLEIWETIAQYNPSIQI
jgi:sulfatase maturation enzyme AslB (radical SAM superfamily)